MFIQTCHVRVAWTVRSGPNHHVHDIPSTRARKHLGTSRSTRTEHDLLVPSTLLGTVIVVIHDPSSYGMPFVHDHEVAASMYKFSENGDSAVTVQEASKQVIVHSSYLHPLIVS
eukprot:TRINITY_DN1918_c0_g1_i1.p1 TRINITY_DN1918_c0_g1~~TRINITY_DN1918_c0_g1_i1.p1  ORF type:complete len:114 (-),score=5.43 TRINITY_DN1918_c0_g1_i1:154-495(-)